MTYRYRCTGSHVCVCGLTNCREELLECVGGPLDGQFATMHGMGAFAWPQGWYYARRRWRNDDSWELIYEWNGDAGFYIPQDHEKWLAGDRPAIVADPPVDIAKIIEEDVRRSWEKGEGDLGGRSYT